MGKKADETKAKRKAAAKRQQKAPGLQSKYARKIRGDYPENSPYRDRWSAFRPFGSRSP